MTRRNQALTLSLDAQDRADLDALAIALDCRMPNGEPNKTELIRQIARGEITLSRAKTTIPVGQEPYFRQQVRMISEAIANLESLGTNA